MVGNVENPCFQKSSRSSTAANWSWICNPRGRGTEFIHSSFLSPPFLYLTNPAHPVSSNRMVQNLWPATGSHSTFFQLRVIQPDLLQSASKRRQASVIVAPRVLTKKRKMITRRVIKKPSPASPSPSESNTNQVTCLSKTFLYCIHMYSGWL